MSDPTFLILGSNSFSGATFCDFLAARGHDVLAASRSPEPHEALLPYRWQKRPGRIRVTCIDINHDLDALGTLVRRDRPTHVVNFAAQSMVAQSWERPEDWMRTNVVSTVKLHDLLRRHDGLERYVHITTPEVYGTTDGWVREEQAYNPSTPYAVSRAAADMSLKTYVETHGFPAVSTRAANVYGPGQPLYRIVPRTVLAAMGGGKLGLDGGGVSRRVFLHARDMAEATYRVALHGRVGDCYHVSGETPISIRELVETVLERLDARFDDCVELGPERPGKDAAYLLDSSKIRRELGWRDSVSLAEGIDETIAWARRFEAALPLLPTAYVHKP